MLSKKSGVIIATIVALFCFISVVYISSCTKPGKGPTCDNVHCENGGYCSVDTSFNGTRYNPALVHCNCPSGFEGPNCATVSAAKFLGTWDVKQTIIGSDSVKLVGYDTTYTVLLEATPTPTTFMIVNLCGDITYNDVVCSIDSGNTSYFTIDSNSAFHMIFDHFKLTHNSRGAIAANDSSISATLFTRHLNYNVNWQNDTLQLLLTPHRN